MSLRNQLASRIADTEKRNIPQPSASPAPEAKAPAGENVVQTAASAATEPKIGLPVRSSIVA